MKKAFTLIELMIVIAIIAIIAAIAIPNLLEARRQANETNAVAALKSYATAQSQYLKAGYELKGRTRMYAKDLYNLFMTKAAEGETGKQIALISEVFANATTADSPYQGYIFHTPSKSCGGPETNSAEVNWANAFEQFALPSDYGNSGLNSYFINTQGSVKMKNVDNVTTTLLEAELPFKGTDGTWLDA